MPSKGGDGTDRGKISKTCRYRMFLDMAEDILCLDEEEYFDLCSESPRRRGRYVDPDDFAGDIISERLFDAFCPFQRDMVAEGDVKGIEEMYGALIEALDGAEVLEKWNPNLCDLMRACFTDSLDGGDWGDGLDFLIEK